MRDGMAGGGGGGAPAAIAGAGGQPADASATSKDGLRAGWRERYSRQIRFAPIGEAGQLRLREASVLIAGCGALGASLAQHMARAGVGRLVIVDRDYVEPSNLHRQSLFDEEDARKVLPKAKAAETKLRRINGETIIEAHVADMGYHNVGIFAADADLILDGTDNAATRLLLCDEAFRLGIPFIYGGATASQGMSAMLVPGRTACLSCLIGEEDGAEEGDSCDTRGVLSATVEFVAALQTAEAVKWLTGNKESVRGTWLNADVWNFAVQEYKLPSGVASCGKCGCQARSNSAELHSVEIGLRQPLQDSDDVNFPDNRDRESRLHGRRSTALCGRDTVQVTMGFALELEREIKYLERLGCGVTINPYLVKAELPSPCTEKLVLFPDGRVLVQGTSDMAEAERICDEYLSRHNRRVEGTAG
ncbi:ThiF family adenylyltransferase [Paenibacillus sp. PAMC21692]|uniref:ThiF family adenylyltransferase n=1 Tax=Paenibacillus sp. PAMC21692 TaxID=2762320 RepID=UPI0021C34270|nr:ThiF family adenylyltransferase [Paenibacillus sp. PAMC21692]